MMSVPNKGQKEVDSNEGAGGAGCQLVGSPINLNNTGTRQTGINNNAGTQSQVFPIIIKDNVYSLTLMEMTDLHGQVWTQLHNR